MIPDTRITKSNLQFCNVCSKNSPPPISTAVEHVSGFPVIVSPVIRTPSNCPPLFTFLHFYTALRLPRARTAVHIRRTSKRARDRTRRYQESASSPVAECLHLESSVARASGESKRELRNRQRVGEGNLKRGREAQSGGRSRYRKRRRGGERERE